MEKILLLIYAPLYSFWVFGGDFVGYSSLSYDDYVENIDYWVGSLGIQPPLWASKLSEKGYTSVSAVDFYNDLFGDDLEVGRMPDDYITGEYAGIAVERVPQVLLNGIPKLNSKGHQEYRGKRYTVTQGNIELYDLIDASENFCMISPISYSGRSRKIENARYLYALCIEVDYIEPKNGIDELVYSWERDYLPIPKPTYVVCSGNGLHLYYVFERPIPLWKNIYKALSEAKKWLTPRIWTQFVTTACDNIQYESLNQPFRCVGSITKSGSYVMAFLVGEKVTVEYINKFLPEDKRIESFYRTKCTLEQAKELYPKWYQRRILEGKEKGHFNRYKPIYFNWIEKILSGAVVGKRYNCLENLCSLAVQCQIEPEQVESDCRKVAERFEQMTVSEDNHFTDYDVICALKTYYTANETAYSRRIEFISKKTGIELIPNKRNYRKQEQHLKLARGIRHLKAEMGENVSGGGRPKGSGTAEDTVKQWRINNPDGRKVDCIRDTGLSKKTVYKWWNS